MNDMIVIFDRVRENTRLSRREPLESAINTSLNQTLTRTVITSGTVFMAVLALFLFGGEVLEGFAFTMLVGTVRHDVLRLVHRAVAGHHAQPEAVAGSGARTAVEYDRGRRSRSRRANRNRSARRARNSLIAGVTLLAAALLGLVQGVTEFLPISSTAHLLILGQMLGYEDPASLRS